MKTNSPLRTVLLSLAAALFATGSVTQADVVYGDLNSWLNPGTRELGDEIVLGTGSSFITDFTFQLWEAGLRGSNEEPPHQFFLTDGLNSQAGMPTLDGPLPDNFTWTVTFRGAGGVGEPAGVDLYNPPMVGGNQLEYWENTGPGGGEYRGDYSGGTVMNVPARLGVVPEPGVMALVIMSGLAALVARNLFKRS